MWFTKSYENGIHNKEIYIKSSTVLLQKTMTNMTKFVFSCFRSVCSYRRVRKAEKCFSCNWTGLERHCCLECYLKLALYRKLRYVGLAATIQQYFSLGVLHTSCDNTDASERLLVKISFCAWKTPIYFFSDRCTMVFSIVCMQM